MVIRLGNQSEPSKMYLGGSEVQKVYLGGTEVWSNLVVSSGTLTIVNTSGSKPNLNIDISSEELGTLYYGFYPDGTTEGDIIAANLAAGTDAGLVANGTAGVFLAVGEIDDVAIDTSALSGGTTYALAFVVNIDDESTYSNVVLLTY